MNCLHRKGNFFQRKKKNQQTNLLNMVHIHSRLTVQSCINMEDDFCYSALFLIFITITKYFLLTSILDPKQKGGQNAVKNIHLLVNISRMDFFQLLILPAFMLITIYLVLNNNESQQGNYSSHRKPSPYFHFQSICIYRMSNYRRRKKKLTLNQVIEVSTPLLKGDTPLSILFTFPETLNIIFLLQVDYKMSFQIDCKSPRHNLPLKCQSKLQLKTTYIYLF